MDARIRALSMLSLGLLALWAIPQGSDVEATGLAPAPEPAPFMGRAATDAEAGLPTPSAPSAAPVARTPGTTPAPRVDAPTPGVDAPTLGVAAPTLGVDAPTPEILTPRSVLLPNGQPSRDVFTDAGLDRPNALTDLEASKLAMAREAIAAAEAAGTRRLLAPAPEAPEAPPMHEIEALKLQQLRSTPPAPRTTRPGAPAEKGAQR